MLSSSPNSSSKSFVISLSILSIPCPPLCLLMPMPDCLSPNPKVPSIKAQALITMNYGQFLHPPLFLWQHHSSLCCLYLYYQLWLHSTPPTCSLCPLAISIMLAMLLNIFTSVNNVQLIPSTFLLNTAFENSHNSLNLYGFQNSPHSLLNLAIQALFFSFLLLQKLTIQLVSTKYVSLQIGYPNSKEYF